MGDSPRTLKSFIDLTGESYKQDPNSMKAKCIVLDDTQDVPSLGEESRKEGQSQPSKKADRGKGLSFANRIIQKYSGRARKGIADRGKGLSMPPPGKKKVIAVEETQVVENPTPKKKPSKMKKRKDREKKPSI